jgi:DNA-directed RNA polymerase specialized sigma24 family protein
MMVGDLVSASSDSDVYEQLSPELIRFATALVGRADTADVLSAAVVKVLASPSWGDVVNRRAYLYRAVFHEACSWKRRSRQRRDLESRVAGDPLWEMPAIKQQAGTAAVGPFTDPRQTASPDAKIVLTYTVPPGVPAKG